MKYLIVIEETKTGFSAYSPDIDGCIATGETKQEVENNMQKAMEFHLEGMLMEKQEIPHSHTYSNYLEVKATIASTYSNYLEVKATIASHMDKKEYIIRQGYFDISDNIAFRTIKDACNCFGHNHSDYRKSVDSHPDPDITLWFPKLFSNKEWDNKFFNNEEIITEKNKYNLKNKEHILRHINDKEKRQHQRILFAKVRGNLGDVYRFKGLYKLDIQESNEETGLVFKRTKTRVKTYGHLDLIRKILILLNEHEHGFAPKLKVYGFTDEQIGYHCDILKDAGLIEAVDTTTLDSSSPTALPLGLTWKGHEFIDDAQKAQAKDKIKGLSVLLKYFN